MNSPAAAEASTERHLAAVPDAGGLFAAYSSQIFAYCLHNLGSRGDAEDALQTTFLQAHRALRRGVVPECESAWLTAIAKNVCRWQRRTRARRATASDEDLDVSTLPAPAGDDSRGAAADLKDALASIPERQRRALLLREWRGLQPSEIAPHLGASTSETYALLSRARRSVASALTAAAHRPVLGLDFGSLLLQVRSLLASGPAAVGATAVAIGVGVAGVTVERAVVEHHPAKPAPGIVSRAPAAVAPRGRPVQVKKSETSPRATAEPGRSRVSRTSIGAAHEGGDAARTAASPQTTRADSTQSAPGSAAATTPTLSPTAPAAAHPVPAVAPSPAPSRPASPSPLASATPLPVELPPPVSTAVSTVVATVSDPPPASDPSVPTTQLPPAPLPQLPPPVDGLLP